MIPLRLLLVLTASVCVTEATLAQSSPRPAPSSITDAQLDAVKQRLLPGVRGVEVCTPPADEQAAKSYGEHVIRATDGDRAYDEQAPYNVADEGDSWRITGSQSRQPAFLDPAHVALVKADAAVLSYGLTLRGIDPSPVPSRRASNADCG